MLYQKLISSHSTWAKVTGAVLKKGWLLIPLAASVALTALNIPEGWQRVWGFVSLSLFAAIMISACNTLTDIFTLLRRESHITRCQIWILIAIGIWLVGAIVILDIQKDSKYGLVFGLVGSVLAWIFQDKIKGAAAFLHIRSHKLIKIGDWIQLPGKGVDGEVKKVTLTTVTLCNWDTTTSTIPISALQQDHFINLQNMAEGKTYGRQMVKNFILDTSCVRPLTEEEAARLRAGEAGRYIPASQIQAGVLNARLFREYVHHYLMAPSVPPRPLAGPEGQRHGAPGAHLPCGRQPGGLRVAAVPHHRAHCLFPRSLRPSHVPDSFILRRKKQRP